MESITKEQKDFLDECARGSWSLNSETGLVDITGNFSCSRRGLSDFLGIEFGTVKGAFYCSNNNLVSLEGAPQKVGKSFHCYNNKLVSLEGAPQKVGWGLICDAITLRGCPIDLLDKIYFYRDDKSFILKDLLNRVVNGLAPEIYLKKCYE